MKLTERMRRSETEETGSAFRRQRSWPSPLIDGWADWMVAVRARSVSLLRIIEPLASRGIAAARFPRSPVCPDSVLDARSQRPCRKARSSCKIALRRVRYLCHFNPYFPPRYATNSSRQQTHHDRSHKRTSYELSVNWNRRLTRTPPLICTFARHSWTASAFRDRGRREQKLKKHKRHALAMAL